MIKWVCDRELFRVGLQTDMRWVSCIVPLIHTPAMINHQDLKTLKLPGNLQESTCINLHHDMSHQVNDYIGLKGDLETLSHITECKHDSVH